MSGSLEESAPLVDAPASLTATDRAQHQSRRSSLSLKTTLAVGSACALLVGAAIVSSVNSARDASVQPLGARARSAKADAMDLEGDAATLGGDFYDFERVGGNLSCLPAMTSDYPNAMNGDDDRAHETEHKITPRDCSWYKQLHPFAQQRAKTPSSCAPANTLFVSIADSENYEIAKLSTQRVVNQKCFIERYILITLDADATRKCESEKLFHCLQYADGHAFDGLVHSGGHADDLKYNQLTWFKQKVTLGLLAANVDFFIFDTDVLLFKVPDLGRLVREHPRTNVFYQQDWIGYNALYRGRYPYMQKNENAKQHHQDAWNFNSGQVFWRASPTTLKIQRLALNYGPHPMEQERVAQAINELSMKGEAHAFALSYDDYGSGCADVNKLPGETWDFGSPEVLRHMRSWTTLHCDCGLGKSPGMIMIEARLECLAKYDSEELCVGIRSAEDWEKMKEERGASLGDQERLKKLTPASITRSKMKTMLARFECVLADDGRDCSDITVLALD